MSEFKIGDTVQLKSGGPIMTIETINKGEGMAWCVWFDGPDPKQRHFHIGTLESDNS